jgi:hypothetical protein
MTGEREITDVLREEEKKTAEPEVGQLQYLWSFFYST